MKKNFPQHDPEMTVSNDVRSQTNVMMNFVKHASDWDRADFTQLAMALLLDTMRKHAGERFAANFLEALRLRLERTPILAPAEAGQSEWVH